MVFVARDSSVQIAVGCLVNFAVLVGNVALRPMADAVVREPCLPTLPWAELRVGGHDEISFHIDLALREGDLKAGFTVVRRSCAASPLVAVVHRRSSRRRFGLQSG